MRVCSVVGCGKKHSGCGLCKKHYDAQPHLRVARHVGSIERRKNPEYRAQEGASNTARTLKRLKADPVFRAKEKARNYARRVRRIQTDPVFRLRHNVGGLIGVSFRRSGFKKTTKTAQILGCSPKEFQEYISAKFKPGWTFADQGKLWDLDHIIPISSAETVEDVVRLNHYTNFQPLECHINRNIKKNKRDWRGE